MTIDVSRKLKDSSLYIAAGSEFCKTVWNNNEDFSRCVADCKTACTDRPPDRPPRHPQGRRGLQPRGRRRRRTNFRAVWGELQRVMTMRCSVQNLRHLLAEQILLWFHLCWQVITEKFGGNMMTWLEDCQNSLQLITCVSNTWTVQFCARNVYTFLRQKAFHPHSDNRAFFSYRWEWRRRFLKGKEIGFTALQNEEISPMRNVLWTLAPTLSFSVKSLTLSHRYIWFINKEI